MSFRSGFYLYSVQQIYEKNSCKPEIKYFTSVNHQFTGVNCWFTGKPPVYSGLQVVNHQFTADYTEAKTGKS